LAQVWDISSGKEKYSLQGRTLEPFDIAWSPDGKYLATTGGDDFTLRIWDATPATLTLSGAQEGMQWVSWSPDGNRIVTTGLDNTAVVWDSKTGKPLLTFTEHTDDVQDAFWSPDGSKIVTTDWDNVAKVWDSNTGEVLVNFTGHVGEPPGNLTGTESLFGGGWSPDGSRIATVGALGTVRIWDALTGEEYFVIQNSEAAGPPRWSPDGTRIATCGIPQELQIWDATTGNLILGENVDNVSGKSFGELVDLCMQGGWSPDGKKFITNSWTGNGSTVWDAQTGKKLLVYKAHTGGIGFSTWSPNGKRVATGDANGEIKIWDVETGGTLLSFSVPIEHFLFQLDWSPDGNHLTGAGYADIEIYRVWQSKEDLIAYAKECCVVRELTAEERQQFGLP
jgi:WD40 repeat protein